MSNIRKFWGTRRGAADFISVSTIKYESIGFSGTKIVVVESML